MEPIQEDTRDAIMQELEYIRKSVYHLQQELRSMRTNLVIMVKTLHREQLKQIESCRTAFKMNVERDEDLMEALKESANPWDG